MSWFYLIIGGMFEFGWTVGMKIATTHKLYGTAIAVVGMGLSCIFLYLAQRTIPIGTAYAVWTGIGAVGAAAIGMIFWNDPVTFQRILGLSLVIIGILTLKMAA